MKILLLGKNGQLGWEYQRTLATFGEIIAFDFPEIDLSHPETIRPVIRQVAPQILVNATAYTAVDRAESEPELCRAINAVAPAIMAEETARLKAALFHFSTDYVFDGEPRNRSSKNGGYVETDSTHPLNIYGQTKLAGEQGVSSLSDNWMTFRTSWVYSLRRDSFVSKVLQWSRQQKSLRLVTDQISSPTWARLLAEITSLVIAQATSHPDSIGWLKERTGLYHLAGDGQASRLEWGQEVLKVDPNKREQITEQIVPSVTADFPSPAQRPHFSVLNCTKFKETFDLQLPPWRDALRMAMESVNG
jgi:dTDP-4-dehydrorhamnose reductase